MMTKSRFRQQGGYTLVEVLISLFIFIAIAVPMLTAMVTNTGALRSQEALVAAWLLEQEAVTARLFPEDIIPMRRRMVDGKEWVITASQQGSPLTRCDLTAMHLNKKCGNVVLYVTRMPGASR